jgi:hypothetical protein
MSTPLPSPDRTAVLIEMLRMIVAGDITSDDAGRCYSGVLQRLSISPVRSLEEDLADWSPTSNKAPEKKPGGDCPCGGHDPADCQCKDAPWPTLDSGEPDFAQMTSTQKVAFNRAKWDRILS